jgi:hypothetical protein
MLDSNGLGDIQVLRENGYYDLDVARRVLLADLLERSLAVRLPIGKHILEEGFPELVARAFRSPCGIA